MFYKYYYQYEYLSSVSSENLQSLLELVEGLWGDHGHPIPSALMFQLTRVYVWHNYKYLQEALLSLLTSFDHLSVWQLE